MTTLAAETGVSTWTIDPYHSSAEFAVKHLMVSTVRGRFGGVEGALRIDEADPAASSVSASIDVATVATGVEQRDQHLRSGDFFGAEEFPRMTFASTRVERRDGERWRVTGDLTVRDVTKQVVLETESEGRGQDMDGKERAGFTATTTLNRKDFGLTWNALLETGGVAVGDTVKITLGIEAIRAG